MTLNVTNSSDSIVPFEGYQAAAIILFLIGFFGFTLNLLVIKLMWTDKQLWTPLNVILFNLVISDFLMSILGNPWTFTSALYHRWLYGRTGCVLYGFTMSLLGITSITTLTVLAIERYLIIAQPFRSSTLNHRKATILVIVIWFYSFMLTSPPLFGWGEYVNESANISCSINWENRNINSMSYILFLFAFGFFIPLIFITFSYFSIIRTMKKTSLRMGQVNKAEAKVAYIILLMIGAFLLAWSPYAVLALIIQFGDESIVISPAMSVFPALLAKSSICYNPIIYVGLNAQFKQAWIQGRHKEKKTTSSYETCALTSRFVTRQLSTESKPKEDTVFSVECREMIGVSNKIPPNNDTNF